MSESKHTPGPWHVCQPAPTDRPGVDAGSDISIVVFGDPSYDDDDAGIYGATPEEAQANARLIAASPDGLELAEDALPILEAVLEDREAINGEEDEILRDLIDRTRNFIARATGAA